MLKYAFPAVLLGTLFIATVAHPCGYGFAGRNGQLLVYLENPPTYDVDKQNEPPTQPMVIDSPVKAEAYFDEFALRTLNRSVDWTRQEVLVFTWLGATDDQLQATEDMQGRFDRVFRYKPGSRVCSHEHVLIFRVDRDEDWVLENGR